LRTEEKRAGGGEQRPKLAIAARNEDRLKELKEQQGICKPLGNG
jgi:hypothetical protein